MLTTERTALGLTQELGTRYGPPMAGTHVLVPSLAASQCMHQQEARIDHGLNHCRNCSPQSQKCSGHLSTGLARHRQGCSETWCPNTKYWALVVHAINVTLGGTQATLSKLKSQATSILIVCLFQRSHILKHFLLLSFPCIPSSNPHSKFLFQRVVVFHLKKKKTLFFFFLSFFFKRQRQREGTLTCWFTALPPAKPISGWTRTESGSPMKMPRTNLFKPLSTTSQDAHLQEAVIGCRGSRTHTRHTAVECTHPNWQTNSSASAYSKFPSYRPHWLQCNLPSVPPWRPCYLSKVELSSVHFLEFPGVFQRLPVPTLT